MKNLMILSKKLTLIVIAVLFVSEPAYSANWLKLQGTEPPGSTAKPHLWGFIQPEYQQTSGTFVPVGPWIGKPMLLNKIAPDLDHDETFQFRRARVGVRGRISPPLKEINYFVLAELGNNGVTDSRGGTGAVTLTDASLTLNYIPGARIRAGLFKYPGSEEGLQAIHVYNYINFTNVSSQIMLERFFDEDGSRNGITPNIENRPNGPVGAFRDIGIQIFDSFKMNDWEHSYALMLGNGNGIDRTDNDNKKDIYLYWSSELVFGGKGVFCQGFKTYAWYQDGKRSLDFVNGVSGTKEFDRQRWGIGSIYERGKYRISGEYIKANGMIFNGSDSLAVPGSLNVAGTAIASYDVLPSDEADGWYLDLGYKIIPKLELDARYDILHRGTEIAAGQRDFQTITLGAQWFFTKKIRLIGNYEFRDAEAPRLPATSSPNKILDAVDDRASVQLLAVF